ncbi:MAG: hypothetical protein A2V63_05375, partial [Candidatus Eisenbacteria bacterium RBG_19FT_COMBO_70_11]
ALGKLGDRASTPLVVRYLDDATARLRGAAAVALWRLADSTALVPLLRRHDDPDPEVRWRVLYALEKIPAPDQVVLVTALHVDDAEWRVRAHAARTLGRQRAARASPYLVQKLGDQEPAVVVEALRGLQTIADTTCGLCVSTIVEALGHPHPYVRLTAAQVLGERFAWVPIDSTARNAALDSLAVHLRDPDAATRAASGRALLARRGRLEGGLRALLSDSSVYVRAAMVEALARLDSATAVPLLSARLRADRPLLVRMTAAEALGALGARDLSVTLRAALGDTSVLFVASVAGALAALGDTLSLPELARAYAARAADADADARIAIRDALRRL